MTIKKLTVLALADTMLASERNLDSLIAACGRVFGAPPPWASEVCAALIERTGENFYYFSRHEIAGILLQLLSNGGDDNEDNDDVDDGDEEAPEPMELPPIRRYCIDPPIRPPKDAWLAALALPELPTVGDLAAWLDEPIGALDWFADQWRLAGDKESRLQHYHYRWVPKRSGGLRLIEIPKERLRRIQQKILRQILDLLPPHPAAHGFRRGHSCLTHAALHAGQRVVIRMDLKDFFPSVPLSRIHAVFEKLGYPDKVAGALARVCVNRAPHGVFRDTRDGASVPWAERQALKSPHLPQGSPCSPALANLCAYRLDVRLEALALAMGASYSRYADDLAFSGDRDFARAAERFHIQVAAIALEEGFRINTRKTRLMREGTRQQVTGVVVNAHPNIARDEYDRLKATLTNCVRHGPASQNRDAHPDFRAYLAGRISYVKMVNASRAIKLQRLLAAVAWPD
ncbi:reverse transcriptase family protein [Duganella sp. HH101]|uniref:reverse transcriptase family protein n=1 Tax=Duganella sp. HH101 TaxID=1781066 RepID=UPI00087475C2|nr:reverse transcriptase family protein [Duganella sp. HH101]OEZ98559.1 reverse transcriptase (RNA-dependent DNA polymerase) [Duganella sp. HH101]